MCGTLIYVTENKSNIKTNNVRENLYSKIHPNKCLLII